MTARTTLTALGERVAEDGPLAHDLALQHLSVLVVDIAPGAAAALADRRAPDVVRVRALAVASAVLLRGRSADSHRGVAA